uniref:Uncharacterized protein n=1 Tax=Romanomermis culicivorax TaxID=13658 RepID=A0A915LAN4_ROMCU
MHFQHKRIHKKTWQSLEGCTFNEIDFICISQKWRSSLRDARAYGKVDVGSDHYLVRGEMKLKLRNQKQRKPKRRFTNEELKDPTNANAFTLEL